MRFMATVTYLQLLAFTMTACSSAGGSGGGGASPSFSAQSQADSAASNASTSAVYTQVTTALTGSGDVQQQVQAKLQVMAKQKPSAVLSGLIAQVSNNPFVLGALNVSGLKDKLVAAQSTFADLDAEYPTLGDLWHAQGFNPDAKITEATLRAALAQSNTILADPSNAETASAPAPAGLELAASSTAATTSANPAAPSPAPAKPCDNTYRIGGAVMGWTLLGLGLVMTVATGGIAAGVGIGMMASGAVVGGVMSKNAADHCKK